MYKLIIFLPFFFQTIVQAQDLDKYGVEEAALPVGLEVGDTIDDLPLNYLMGDQRSIDELLEEKPLVVLFYRGEWCPVCMKYLSNLTDSLALIEEKANVIVVSPEKREKMLVTYEQYPQFTYVLDTNELMMTSFDVLFNVTDKYQKKISTFLKVDISEHNNKEDARLPVPATYVINKNGVIIYRQFDYNYKERASALSILKALE